MNRLRLVRRQVNSEGALHPPLASTYQLKWKLDESRETHNVISGMTGRARELVFCGLVWLLNSNHSLGLRFNCENSSSPGGFISRHLHVSFCNLYRETRAERWIGKNLHLLGFAVRLFEPLTKMKKRLKEVRELILIICWVIAAACIHISMGSSGLEHTKEENYICSCCWFLLSGYSL